MTTTGSPLPIVGSKEEEDDKVSDDEIMIDSPTEKEKDETKEALDFLPDHTESMRQAGQHCLKLWQMIDIKISSSYSSSNDDDDDDNNNNNNNSVNKNKTYKKMRMMMLPSTTSSRLSLTIKENQHAYLQRREEAKRTFWTTQYYNPREVDAAAEQLSFEKKTNKPPTAEDDDEVQWEEEQRMVEKDQSKASSIPVFHFCTSSTEQQQQQQQQQAEGTATLEWPSTIHSSTEQSMIEEFQQKYQHLNIPCLVTGLDRSFFRSVDEMWRKTNAGEDENLTKTLPSSSTSPQLAATTTAAATTISSATGYVPSSSSPHCPRPHPSQSSSINRRWFLDNLGEDFIIPLRYDPAAKLSSTKGLPSSSGMDDDGRAAECQTKFTTIKEWIKILEEEEKEDHRHQHCPYYLKDWHFQQQFEATAAAKLGSSPTSLYACPTIFAPDLLNTFLIKFTDGDYRFLYWGPKGSFTGRHSDVIHSFSWSYNVVGVKEWKFFPPPDCYLNVESQEKECRGTIKVRQEAGQAIFVPATWQHEVVNLEETISLNHNWISTSNLDLSWDCIFVEIKAIQAELLDGWWTEEMITSNRIGFIETCENMLRGCVGLDVTSFFLMTLSQLLLTIESSSTSSLRTKQQQFDTFRLLSTLQSVMELDKKYGSTEQRMKAILQSDELTDRLIYIAKTFLDSF